MNQYKANKGTGIFCAFKQSQEGLNVISNITRGNEI